MKKLIMVLLCFALTAPAFALVVGRVDMQRILLSVAEGKAVRASLKVDFDKKEAEIKSEREEIQKAQQAFEKQSLVMNGKAKEKRQREIQEMMIKFEQKTMGMQREIQARQNKETQPLIQKIATVVQEVSKADKIDITYEVSAGAVVYASNEVDLTDKVIKAYDKKHPSK